MPYASAAAALRDYYTAIRGGVRAGSMERREIDKSRIVSDGRAVELAAIGRVLAGFDEIGRALLQWRYDPFFEREAFTWARVCEELPTLAAFRGARQVQSSIGGRDLEGKVEQGLRDEWVVR